MKDEDLMRRISDALDAPGGIDADPELRAALAADPEAARYAEDLIAIGTSLEGLRARPEPDWSAMLAGIEARLDSDEALDDLDATAPPVFADEPRRERATTAAAAAAPRAGAEVVDLAARRQSRRQVFALVGGLAAAAAVGLGITAGLSMNDTAPAASGGYAMEQAAAPVVAEVPAAAPAAPAPPPSAEPLAMADQAEAEAPAWPAEPAPDPAPPLTATGAFAPEPAAAVARGAARPMDRRTGSGGGAGGYGIGGDLQDDWGGPAAGRAPGGPSPTPSAGPTRVEVVNALNAVADAVAACMTTTHEVAEVHVRVNGATGRVESVTVEPPFAGAEAACIVRAVRGAAMPTSAHPSYDVVHAYHPAPLAGGSLGSEAPAAARRARQRAPAPARAPASRDSADMLSPFAE